MDETSLARYPFRGLLHALYWIGGSLLFVVAMWFIWAAIARHRLAAKIDAIKALHQPFQLEDFAGKPIPDNQNAAVLWKAAFAALPADTKAPSNSILIYPNRLPYPPAWHQMEDESVVVCAPFFAKARIAAAASEADWGIDGLAVWSLMRYQSPSRIAANTLADAIVHAHLHGNDALAIERAIELMHLSHTLAMQPIIVTQLIASGSASRAADAALFIATTPKLRDYSSESDGSASKAQVARLIQLLLDDKKEQQVRAAAADEARLMLDEDSQVDREQYPLLAPMITLSEARTLERRKLDRSAAAAPTAWDANRLYRTYVFPTWWGSKNAPPDVTFDEYGSLQSSLSTEWKAIAARREAAVALAMRLFEADHGRLPTTLAELVPAYLPSVPQDPFSPVGFPMKMPVLTPSPPASLPQASNPKAK
jgi:hypothetical protein